MAWTEQMIEDLKRMWDEGLTTGEIGKRLGVTKNSIIGKVHRLQLTARPSPIKKKDENAPATPKTKDTKSKKSSEKNEKATKETISATPKSEKKEEQLPIEEKHATVEKEIKKLPIKEETVEEATSKEEASSPLDRIETIRNSVHVEHPKGKHKTLLTDLDNHTCRWPIGDPKDDNFHFCGRKVKIGQTYCEEHAAIAYVKATGKK